MNEAVRQQTLAADPGRSTWLSANAGAGKTRVLTDRVARLLLGGVPPQNILCLTYTKAAAGEMQNRLFRRLGGWAMLGDDDLRGALAQTGIPGPVAADRLARARRLFASAIDTPGGLKIQTIHAFCAAILRQFPLEAGITPGFREIDERESRQLLRDVFDTIAEGAQADRLAAFARYTSVGGLDALLSEIVGAAAAFETPVSDGEIAGWFGLAPEETADSLRDTALAHDGALEGLVSALRAGTPTLRRKAEALAGYRGWPAVRRFDELRAQLLTLAGTPVKLVLDHARRDSAHAAASERLIAAVATANRRLGDLAEAGRAIALHRFAHVYVGEYAARKAAAGVLDFDDLIARTLALLRNPAVCDWVLFRLDGGVDHILIDEAQDTSPAQWAIVERLAQEFASGAGARHDVRRTIFAVGDQKQSIYSFQGADPAEFERMRRHFARRLADASPPFQSLGLRHSFRASALLLRLVDAVFATAPLGVAESPGHLAFHEDLPGRIDLWPLIDRNEAAPLPEWHDPGEREQARDAVLVLADRVAAEVRDMIETGRIPDGAGGMRAVAAGDVMILLRRRTELADPLILALKRAGIAVAGADRIELAAELAVKDIVAVLAFLAMPADDLSLAAALRSPLFGLTESDLYHLARDRPGTLWEALRARAGEFPGALVILEDLRRQADFLRPFELISRLLVRHRGRQRLIGRLGPEVGEAIDVLLQQALAYETTEVPSLSGFLVWHASDGMSVKRQAEAAGGKVRVMTVHGAKGLESAIVILPDTADRKGARQSTLIRLPGGQAVFRAAREKVPEALADVYADDAARAAEESNRLLYVALTRAKYWLIVCGVGADAVGAGTAGPDRVPCWHRMITDALEPLGPHPLDVSGVSALRVEHGDWAVPELVPTPEAVPASVPGGAPARDTDAGVPAPLPGWAALPAGAGPETPAPLSPSGLGPMTHGAIPAEGDAAVDDALARGARLHLLLERLPLHPRDDWPEAARAILADGVAPLDQAMLGALLAEARAVLDDPALAPIFGEGSLAEVGIAAGLPELGGRRISGRIDRLVRTPGHLLAVDFKSNREVPGDARDIPDGILMQLGAYASALGRIFPGEAIELAILWTRHARLMPVPRDLALAALGRVVLPGPLSPSLASP